MGTILKGTQGDIMSALKYDVLVYPGIYLSKDELAKLTEELRDVSSKCFDDIPYYQVLTGKRDEFQRAIICTARNAEGKLVGFCSSLVLDIESIGTALHLGLTCVDPIARGKKLTHKLMNKLLVKYLLMESPINGVWITNCACVLSSLGNVALYFEDIYPSPFGKKAPSPTHLKIAQGISKSHRSAIAINYDAKFNSETFVFEGSVSDSVFEKSEADTKYYHRNRDITNYYKDILNFERGDEVLQIGRISLLSLPKYLLRNSKRKFKSQISIFGDKLAAN